MAYVVFWGYAPIQENAAVDLEQAVLRAFRETHAGYSSDEVVLNDDLNRQFLQACRRHRPGSDPYSCNWKLMNMRKAGKLKTVKTTKRGTRPDRDLIHVAEIVARRAMDLHQVSVDRIMADPKKRADFDREARKYNASLNLYEVRKAAFQLRKTRRLRPELITRIADWNREINTLSLQEIESDFETVPKLPGIYVFHDSHGYLYIGQAENLRKRLQQHLKKSSNDALFNYLGKSDSRPIWVELHSFPADSRISELRVRRAYESELIRNRKPKFNILP